MQPKKAGRMKRCMHLEISRAKEQTRHAQNGCTGLYTPNTTSLPPNSPPNSSPILPPRGELSHHRPCPSRLEGCRSRCSQESSPSFFFFAGSQKVDFTCTAHQGRLRSAVAVTLVVTTGAARARGHKGGVSRRADAGGTESEPRPGSERGERGARCCLAARGRTRA